MGARTVADVGERELVARILEILGAAGGDREQIVVGPGDDAAVLAGSGEVVATTDSQHEGIHFVRDWMAPETLGRRAIAINASDLGAMGAEPQAFLTALALPGDTEIGWAEGLAAGLAAGAASWGAAVVGGDVARVEGQIAINVTALGRMPPGTAPVRRSGAAAGQLCWVTGWPGRAAAGRGLLQAGYRLAGDRIEGVTGHEARLEGDDEAGARRCIHAFTDPRPPVAFGVQMARRGLATAMLDISDSVAIDLGRLCAASGVGCRVEATVLYADDVLEGLASAMPVGSAGRLEEWVLGGGEDYQLLGAAPPERRGDVLEAAREAGVALRFVGVFCTAAEGLQIERDGRRETLPALGWDHFSWH